MSTKLIRIPASIPLSVINEAVAKHNKTLKEFFFHNQELIDLVDGFDYEGFKIVELKSHQDLKDEGVAMGHSLGAHYPTKETYFSLRSPNGASKLTIEVDIPNKKIVNVYGKYNNSNSVVKYQKPFNAFVVSMVHIGFEDKTNDHSDINEATESFGGECQDLERWVKSTFKNNEVVFTKNGHRCSLEFYKYDYCSVKLSVQGETIKLTKHFDRAGDSHLDVTKTYPLEKLGIAKDDFIKYKSSVEASVFSDRG